MAGSGAFFTRPWDSKPGENVGLAAEWLSDLKALSYPAGRPYANAVPLTSTPQGPAWKFNGTSDFIDTEHTPVGASATLLVVCKQVSAGVFVSSCNSAGEAGIELAFPGVGQVFARCRTSGTALQTTTTKSGLTTGAEYVYAARWRAGEGVSLWVSGELVATTAALTGTLNSTQPLRLARRGTSYSAQTIHAVVFWDGYRSDADLARLRRPEDVWGRLFEPRRIFVPVAAAGGGATASVTGAGTTSSAGALAAAGTATTTLAGASATSAAGAVSASTSANASATLTGVGTTASAGTVSATAGGSATATLAGISATSAAGVLTASGAAAKTLTGASAAASAGTVTASSGTNATVTLTGCSVSASVGALSASGAAQIVLTGAGTSAIAGRVSVAEAVVATPQLFLPPIQLPVNVSSVYDRDLQRAIKGWADRATQLINDLASRIP